MVMLNAEDLRTLGTAMLTAVGVVSVGVVYGV